MMRTTRGKAILAVALATARLVFGGNLDYGIPNGIHSNLVVRNRTGYALGFDRSKKQPRWVCYRLTKEMMSKKSLGRFPHFIVDEEFGSDSARPSDYLRSGYDRGHLCPARDMAGSATTLRESFLMSNISPQRPSLNRGVWKRLEEWVRETAEAEGSIFVLCGPILYVKGEKKIGRSVSVPYGFWKIVIDETRPTKCIGFTFLNIASNTEDDVGHHVNAVSNIESYTGLDLRSIRKIHECPISEWENGKNSIFSINNHK